MPLRYLFGPVPAEFAEQNLQPQRQAGACLDLLADCPRLGSAEYTAIRLVQGPLPEVEPEGRFGGKLPAGLGRLQKWLSSFH